MTILKKENDFIFSVEKEFSSIYLTPILFNLLDKIKHNWDDYDEFYHCTQLINKVSCNDTLHMDFHLLSKQENYLGLVLMTTGKIDLDLFFKNNITIDNVETSVVLNYFHIAPAGRGNGRKWLTDIIIPYYRLKGFRTIYLKSSHPKAFSLYLSLGEEIGTYQSISDNKLYTREGKIFKINL